MKRRTFLRNTTLGGLALALPSLENINGDLALRKTIPRRKLGRFSDKLSIIGFGGVMLNTNTQEFANESIAKAFDSGINYYDVAPSYGNAIERMGPALQPYRKKCFLACKTMKRNKDESEKELNKSLQTLKTDYFDLYQMHALTTVEEVEKCFASDGAIKTFQQAKKEGKIRHIGFSAHTEDAALRAMELFDFDTVLFPLNFVCWISGSLGPKVYEKAKQQKMGIFGMKSMVLTSLKKDEARVYPGCWYRPVMDDKTLELALRFTLSLDITAATSPGVVELLWKAIDFSKRFTPLNDNERETLTALARVTEPMFKT